MSGAYVLSLCDYTGNMVQPWLESGYRCITVDLLHELGTHTDGNLTRIGGDILSYLPPLVEYAMVFAFPPCTNLAVSGARWFREKGLYGLSSAIDLVERCAQICEWSHAPWMLENPVSTLSTYWREPDYAFNPCDYGGYLSPPGDFYTKKTCLWTGGGFRMPEPMPVVPTEGSKMHLLSPSPDRANLRSETPRGFARAVFMANAPVGVQDA